MSYTSAQPIKPSRASLIATVCTALLVTTSCAGSDSEPSNEPNPTPSATQPHQESHLQRNNATEGPGSASEVTISGELDGFLENLRDQHPGDISVSVKELDGEQREGSVDGAEPFRVASTYKVYVAYTLLQQVEAGEISWQDPVVEGRNVSECLDAMLMFSDNPCPEKLAEDIGWERVYSDAAEAGAVNTGDGEGSMQTTANDLTQFMVSMETGQLDLGEDSLERLEAGLSGNEYREGVPSGSSGVVLDKPGFIEDFLHDAAVVHHPEGTYAITVLTEDSSWESIAEITRSVEAELYE